MKVSLAIPNRLIVTCSTGIDHGPDGGVLIVKPDMSVQLVFSGSCRGIVKKDDHYFVLSEHQVIRFDGELKEREHFTLGSLDLHGLRFYRKHWYIVETGRNTVGIYNENFRRTGEIRISDYSSDRHHFNDLWIEDDNLLLSMLSLSGPEIPHSDKNDGAIIEISLHDFSRIKHRVTGVKHPHSCVVYNGSLYYCTSWENGLGKDGETVYRAGGYTRGLTITPQYIYLGQSKVRSYPSQAKASGGISILDHGFQLQEFIELPADEVYGIIAE